jgi:hypothetical protein
MILAAAVAAERKFVSSVAAYPREKQKGGNARGATAVSVRARLSMSI